MMKEFPTRYDHHSSEKEIYTRWEESGYFNPDNLPEQNGDPFCVIMPPPNANGHLHAGHGLDMTLKDILIRYKRMRGFRTLWVPGADHAGFETQIVYERKLEKEGRTRFEMSREEFYKEVLAFTLENKKYMESEVRALGASCDWSREKFTLDPEIVSEVHRTFKKLHEDGLLYRGKRIVNWCPKHQTSLSDVETEFKEKKDPFYYLQYGPFVIGTARPETKFGDKHVVVHPDDPRYESYKDGQEITLEWINGPVTATIIKDAAIDREFGTGVMTITPWHDAVDFEIAERHGLKKEQIIDFKGKLLPIAQEFAGTHIEKARPLLVQKLKEKGLLVKIDEEYTHSVRVCYKCGTMIEPQIMDQWFVKMKPLAEMAMKPVRDGKITFIPENFQKIFFHWMENTIDWNISRQIVWGIPIPAKICEKCDEGFPDLENQILQCPTCGGQVRPDTDTFDTWFSSGQWPLLALGFPHHKDFKEFYPTSVMETGADLVFKWVPRMIIFGMYLAKDIPFKTVYFHGMVNDAQKQKMSKSKGNVVSPIEIGEKYGTDALRMALVVGNTAGSNLALSEDKIRGYRNFSTKIWNAARFVLMNKPESLPQEITLSLLHQERIEEVKKVKEGVAAHIENFEFHLAAEKAYHYFWHTFADKIIEENKEHLRGENPEEKAAAYEMLKTILEESLTMLHPFMPFVTEAVYEHVRPGKLLMIEKW